MDIRTDIVVSFGALVCVVLIFFLVRSVYRATEQWWEDAREEMKRRKLAAQLLKKMESGTREQLAEIALAVALAPHHWPDRKNVNDEGLAKAGERHLAVLTSLSDEDLKHWIELKLRDTHSIYLNIALESLDSVAPVADNQVSN